MYIADTANQRIRKVDTNGIITTLMGTGLSGYSGDNGLATSARVYLPYAVALNSAGNLFVADTNNNRIRTTAPVVSINDVTANEGNSNSTTFNFTVTRGGDSSGTMTVDYSTADGNATAGVDYIAASGTLSFAPGETTKPITVTVNGDTTFEPNEAFTLNLSHLSGAQFADGSGLGTILNDENNPMAIVTYAGTGATGYSGDSGSALNAKLFNPTGLTFDTAGNLYIADTSNNRIRKVDKNGVISTVAGKSSNAYSGDGGAAINAYLNYPDSVAIDGAGNIYISDSANNRIRKINTSGIISTVAGSYNPDYGGDGGAATSAFLNYPTGLALDSAGNLYIADTGNNRIRKVSSSGIISTVAGTGTAGFSGDGGAATSANLNVPHGIACDSAGNLYIADTLNCRIRKVDMSGTISTVAGTGTAGFSGDRGAATSAQINAPVGIICDSAGNVYFADNYNHRVRRLDALGYITTVAGVGILGYSGDGGLATSAQLNYPSGVAINGAGDLFIADTCNHRIRTTAPLFSVTDVTANEGDTGTTSFTFAVTHSGDTSVVDTVDYSTADGTATAGVDYTAVSGTLSFAAGESTKTVTVTINGDTTIETNETFSLVLRNPSVGTLSKGLGLGSILNDDVDPTLKIIGTYAGTGTSGYSGDGIGATSARLNYSAGVALDSAGNCYIADTNNNRIRKVSPVGIITTVAGNGVQGYSGDGGQATSASLYNPFGITLDGAGNLYIADWGNQRVRKVDTAGVITTVAGTGTSGYSGDGGAAASAQLHSPTGVTFNNAGNLFIADCDNHCVRQVDASGVITTVAGNGTTGYSGNGSAAIGAQLSNPFAMAFDGTGNLYIAEYGNNCVRKVDTSGLITTVAGTGTAGYSGDDGVAASAQLNKPTGIAVDSMGNLLVADKYNHRIRKVYMDSGLITTVVGTGTAGYGGDNGPATAAKLCYPSSVALNSAGYLFIADQYNQRIRTTAPVPSLLSINNVSANEGDMGTTPFTFTVTRSGGTLSPVTVNYSTADGTATAAVDYIPTSGTLSFAAGEVTKTITVLVNGDTGSEPDETFTLSLSNPSGAFLSNSSSSGIILNDDAESLSYINTYAGMGYSETKILTPTLVLRSTLALPTGLAFDGAGNLFIADQYDNRICKVNSSGVLSTVAGNGNQSMGGDGGLATSAQLSLPRNLTLDSAGNIYIADTYNNRIRKVSTSGIITTVAGNGVQGYSGDGGAATSAQLSLPYDVAVDGGGNLYIADKSNNRVRKVDTNGIITTVAGNPTGSTGDGILATNASLGEVYGLCFDGTGNLYVSGMQKIYKIDASGIITTYAGGTGTSSDGGSAIGAQLAYPYDMAFDGVGNLFIADFGDNRIRKVSPLGIITTVAGSGTRGFTGDGGPAQSAQLDSPSGIAVNNAGYLFIADTNNQRIRTTAPLFSINDVSANEGDTGPTSFTFTVTRKGNTSGTATVTYNTVDNGAKAGVDYVATSGTLSFAAGETTKTITVIVNGDSDAEAAEAFSVSLSNASGALIAPNSGRGTIINDDIDLVMGVINTLAGGGNQFYGYVSGPATSAALGVPAGVAVDKAGNVYIADNNDERIFQVNPRGILKTIAGNGEHIYGGDGGIATDGSFFFPCGVVSDSAGNFYVADTSDHRIRKVSSSGIITTYAGNGLQGFTGDGGAATSARLNRPSAIALDGAGNLYIADTYNDRIRKVDTAGIITTVAGSGTIGFSGDGGAALTAKLNYPYGIASDTAGNLYIADTNNQRIRKINTAGVITTVAGIGTAGYSGDDGAAKSAQLNSPWGVASDTAGNIYIADTYNNRIRKVNTAGVITTVGGIGTAGYSGDGGGAANAQLNAPTAVAVNEAGYLFIADSGNSRIRTTAPVVTIDDATINEGDSGSSNLNFTVKRYGATTLPLTLKYNTVDGTAKAGHDYVATSGTLTFAVGEATKTISIPILGDTIIEPNVTFTVALSNASGVLLPGNSGLGTIVDDENNPALSVINTYVGTGMWGYSGDGGAALDAKLKYVSGVAIDSAGNLYIADNVNHCIRKVDSNGTITTVAGNGTQGFSGDGGMATVAQLDSPSDMVIDSAGNLFIADTNNNRIRKVNLSGIITTVAGTGTAGYNGDGLAASSAQLNQPSGLVFDSAGNLYIADVYNHRIRKMDLSGIITTVAGTGTAGFSGDGGAATDAQLLSPHNLAFDTGGNLYISDTGNCRIRKVNSYGTITTVAGNGNAGFSGDGGMAITAKLNNPYGIALDGAGNLFIADVYNNRVRKVDTSGIILTAAGTGAQGFSGDGGLSTSAQLFLPDDVAFNSAGNLFIADQANYRVRTTSPLLSINDVTVNKAVTGTTMTFTVTRKGDTSGTATVKYNTADGTALASSDYLATSGTLTFAAGEATKTLSVTILGNSTSPAIQSLAVAKPVQTLAVAAVSNSTPSADKTFNMSLTDPAGTLLAKSRGLGTIVSSNMAPTAQNDSATTSEDTALDIDVVANDSDVETGNTALSVVPGSIGAVKGGTVTLQDDGRTVHFVPDANANDGNTVGGFGFTYQISDGLVTSGSATVTIGVTAVNDAPTGIALAPGSVAENSAAVTVVGALSSTDPDAGDSATYSLVAGEGDTDNASFTIEGNTLKATASFDCEAKHTYSIRVRATDTAGATFEQTLAVTVTNVNEAPTISTATLTAARVSAAYNQTLTASDPDSDTLSWSVTTGALPAGLALSTSGAISGTPTSAGTFAFSVTASDGNGGSDSKAYSLLVKDASSVSVSLSSTSPKTGDVLTATPTASNFDGSLTFTYTWKKGTTVLTETGPSLNLATAGYGDRGDVITVTVTATDGTSSATSAPVSATIANTLPTNLSISPAFVISTYGTAKYFTATYNDGDGFADISNVQMIVGAALGTVNVLNISYDAPTNKLYLRNDAGTALLGGFTPGSNNVISNSQGTLNCASTTVGRSGSTLTVNWNLTPTQAFIGTKNLYLYSKDAAGATAGWNDLSDWVVKASTNSAPSNTSLAPASSANIVGTARSFGAVYSDPDGALDIGNVQMLINTTLNTSNALWCYYDSPTNKLYLKDDAGTTLIGGFAPGSANVITTSQGTLNCAGTVVARNGNALTVYWNVTPSASFVGTKNVFMYVKDSAGATAGWNDLGDWLVKSPTNTAPTLVSLAPANSANIVGTPRSFGAVYSDADGALDITSVQFIINATLTQANGLVPSYDPATDKLFLKNDAGTALIGGFTPGSANVISNSQGSLNCANTVVVRNGNTLTVYWNVTPSASFTGVKNLYQYVRDASNASAGFTDMGDWLVKTSTNVAPTVVSVTPNVSSSAVGTAKSLSAVYSDADGALDIASVQFIINSTLTQTNGFAATYDLATNKLFLKNDAGTTLIGGFEPGSANVISNSQGSLNCAATTVTRSGNNLTVNWNFTPSSSFTGTKNLYLFDKDTAGASAGFTDKGDWTISAGMSPMSAPPTLSPSAGNS